MDNLKKEKKFLSPKRVIESLGIQKGSSVIDFGSGSGFWAIELAKKVGKEGCVFAIDPREENLSIIKSKLDSLGIKNTKLYKAPYSSKSLAITEKADYIFLCNVLSLNKDWKRLLVSTGANANTGASLIVIDWSEKKFLTKDSDCRGWMEEIILAANRGGFEFKKLIPAGDFHFGLYFKHIEK